MPNVVDYPLIVTDSVLVTIIDAIPLDADAGHNQAVDELSTVTLRGTANDHGRTMTYAWSCEGRGADAIIMPPSSSASFTFTAPETHRDIIYTCTFTADDGQGDSDSDSMVLIVRDVPADGPVLNLIGDYTPTVTVGV